MLIVFIIGHARRRWASLMNHQLEIGPEETKLVSEDRLGHERVQRVKTENFKLEERTGSPNPLRPGRVPGYLEVRDGVWTVGKLGEDLTLGERRWILGELEELKSERARSRRTGRD
jgi:hypothetical protein